MVFAWVSYEFPILPSSSYSYVNVDQGVSHPHPFFFVYGVSQTHHPIRAGGLQKTMENHYAECENPLRQYVTNYQRVLGMIIIQLGLPIVGIIIVADAQNLRKSSNIPSLRICSWRFQTCLLHSYGNNGCSH